MRSFINTSLLLVMLFGVLSCAVENSEKSSFPNTFDYGEITEKGYENDFFKIEIPVPSGWYIATKEQEELLLSMGIDLAFGGKKNKYTEATEINSAFLLYAINKPFDKLNEDPASFSVAVENLNSFPEIDVKEYLLQAKEALLASDFRFAYMDEEPVPVELSGRTFYVFNYVMEGGGVQLVIEQYSVIINDFALNLSITHITDDQRAQAMEFLQRLKFVD